MDSDLVRGEGRVVSPEGEIDLTTVEGFQSALRQAEAASPGGFIVDLSRVGFLDSSGIRALILTYRRLAAVDGVLVLVTQGDFVKRLLRVTNLDRLPGVVVCDDLPTAMLRLSTRAVRKSTRP